MTQIRTYKQAQNDIMNELRARGWEVKHWLRVPHATHPDKLYRLWFKPQSVYIGHVEGGSSLKSARSMHVENLRSANADVILEYAEYWRQSFAEYTGDHR